MDEVKPVAMDGGRTDLSGRDGDTPGYQMLAARLMARVAAARARPEAATDEPPAPPTPAPDDRPTAAPTTRRPRGAGARFSERVLTALTADPAGAPRRRARGAVEATRRFRAARRAQSDAADRA